MKYLHSPHGGTVTTNGSHNILQNRNTKMCNNEVLPYVIDIDRLLCVEAFSSLVKVSVLSQYDNSV